VTDIMTTLVLPTGMIREIHMPDDLAIAELNPDLAQALDLPRFGPNNELVKYRLDSKRLGRRLNDNETLHSAGIESGETLILSLEFSASGLPSTTQSQISVGSPIGIPLEALAEVDASELLSNQAALTMTLHSYRATLSQLDDYRQRLDDKVAQVESLRDELKERNIATVLLLLGQILVGFGTNLITGDQNGGWLVLASGVAVDCGALYFVFGGLHTR
jgi:hypothetical protein